MLACNIPLLSHGEGLQDQLNSVFNGMSNVNQPGAYESERRGVIFGGQIEAKTKIMNADLVSMLPPSFKGGCGGVDLFGGSLSYINKDQLVQLLRTVAANAKGYAFQLALQNVCPSCSTWIENFQKKIQALNQYFGNSCQLAQGIMNDTADAMGMKQHNNASLSSMLDGFNKDFFDSNTSEPKEVIKQKKPDEYKNMIGNIVWKQLKANHVAGWFGKNKDDTLLETIMSVTGTVIIGDLKDGEKGKGKTNPITTLPGNKVTLADMIDGSGSKKLTIYSCDSDKDECLNAGTKNGGLKEIKINSLRHEIIKMLAGVNNNDGIIFKLHNEIKLTQIEMNFMSNLPSGIGAFIRNLSIQAPDAANVFAIESASSIALELTYSLMRDLLKAGQTALANSKSEYLKKAQEVLDQSSKNLENEYLNLSRQYGSLVTLIKDYNQIIINIQKVNYHLSDLKSRG